MLGNLQARTWKLPSAKDVKQTAAALASSGFTVVNSPGKNKPPTVAQVQGRSCSNPCQWQCLLPGWPAASYSELQDSYAL